MVSQPTRPPIRRPNPSQVTRRESTARARRVPHGDVIIDTGHRIGPAAQIQIILQVGDRRDKSKAAAVGRSSDDGKLLEFRKGLRRGLRSHYVSESMDTPRSVDRRHWHSHTPTHLDALRRPGKMPRSKGVDAHAAAAVVQRMPWSLYSLIGARNDLWSGV